MFITGYFKNIFNKKDEFGNETTTAQESATQASSSGFNKTFTLGRQKTRNNHQSCDKEKKERSFSISARHAVSSLDVSLNNVTTNSASRISISDFKNTIFQNNKKQANNRTKCNEDELLNSAKSKCGI